MEPTDNHLTLIQNNDVQKRVSELRKRFDQYRAGLANKTVTPPLDLQGALFKAAKTGNIKLMLEFISHGANPFAVDESNCDAISYAMEADPIKTGNMLLELIKGNMQFDTGGDNEK